MTIRSINLLYFGRPNHKLELYAIFNRSLALLACAPAESCRTKEKFYHYNHCMCKPCDLPETSGNRERVENWGGKGKARGWKLTPGM